MLECWKLNQRWWWGPAKNWIQDREGDHVYIFKCRKVIVLKCWKLNQGWQKFYMHKSLSAERLSHLNVENWTKDCEGKICISHYEKMPAILRKLFAWKNFQLPNPSPPKFGFPLWVSTFSSINGKENFCQPLWKKGCHYAETCHIDKFPITDTPKVWVSAFLNLYENGKIALAIKNETHT